MAILEPITPKEELKFIFNQVLDESTDEGEFSDFEESDLAPIKSVSTLKSQFEQMTSQTNKIPNMNPYKATGAVEKLRQRLDQNGYVSQAARSIQAAKTASQLRDSIVISREVKISQRQSAFKEPDQNQTGNFTSKNDLNI